MSVNVKKFAFDQIGVTWPYLSSFHPTILCVVINFSTSPKAHRKAPKVLEPNYENYNIQ